MKVKFLSDEWFNAVEKLVQEAGDLQVPSTIQNVVVNVDAEGVLFHVKDGVMRKGHVDGTDILLTGSADNIRKLFVNTDLVGCAAEFEKGNMEITGDLTGLIKVQTCQPSLQMSELSGKIVEITE